MSRHDPSQRGLRVLFAAGGTGGHLFPAIALADQLMLEEPTSSVSFVGGARGLERRLTRAHGYPLEVLRVGQLKGAAMVARLATLAGLPGATLRSLALLRRFDPHVVVGAGGYVSGPVVLAASLTRCPVVLLEQNAIPGITTRLLARFADRIVVSFAGAAAHLPRRRILHLGNPLRPDLVEALSQPQDRPSADAKRRLLVLGGSQGATRINELMTAAAPALVSGVPGLTIVHQTGEADLVWVREHYQRAGIAAQVQAFVSDMVEAYRPTDLVLGRAGATTLAELALAGLPAVLIPYPHAADDHQTANADELVQAGGAVMLPEANLTAAALAATLGKLLTDDQRLANMSQAMRQQSCPEAAALVVALLRELASL